MRVDRLQVDDLFALDHAEAQSFIRAETYDLHGSSCSWYT